MKKINIFVITNLVLAVLFSLVNICFSPDVSCAAFLVSAVFTGFMVYFLYFQVSVKGNLDKIFISTKFLQYEPFVFLIAFIMRRAGAKGTSFAFDFFCVILWLGIFISGIILQKFFTPKKFESITGQKIKDFKNEKISRMLIKGKTRSGQKAKTSDYAKWFGFEILDWADAIVQAVFTVLLFQIFFFQFYKIPTESMVPEYMVNDRVAVAKITSGPKFPLSDVGLPCIRKFDRGDIVVFRNPHYTINRESEVKTVVSQIVYMLTFTLVNPNTDEHGRLKADPLVKRITGVAGEQLMMQDGILYRRTEALKEFTPVKEDQDWAVYNLHAENEAVKKYIKDLSITDEIYERLLEAETKRNALDIKEAEKTCRELVKEFERYLPSVNSEKYSQDELLSLFTSRDLEAEKMYVFYSDFAQHLISLKQGRLWFNSFMTDWMDSYESFVKDGYVGGNLYDDSSFKLNLLYKIALGKAVVYIAKNMRDSVPSDIWMNSKEFLKNHEELKLLFHCICFQDLRNMPVFPANGDNGEPQYIPENCFFMMGDNRFHSLDMRHTEQEFLAKLTRFDNYSINYVSCMKPMYVPKKMILGAAGIRFWPIGRPVRNSKMNKNK